MLYLFEDFALDVRRRELRRDGAAVAIEPQVFDLLACLIAHRERVVTKEDLREAVWKGRIVSEATLSSRINAARAAIGDNGEDQRLIRTLPRVGFRFVGSVREEHDSAPAEPPTGDPKPIASAAPSAVAAPPPAGTTSRPLIAAAAGAALGAIVTALVFLLWPTPDPPRTAAPRPMQKFDAATVPLVSDEVRKSLAGYPARPDAKALAIAIDGHAVADGAADSEAAKQDALRQCGGRAKRPCRVYAVGSDVVWSKDSWPVADPADLRVEPLDTLLVPDEVPTLPPNARQEVARVYIPSPGPKALALTTGNWFAARANGNRAEAARLALERCVDAWQRPCMLLSVDGFLTVRVPKSRRIVGIFLPSTEPEIAAPERERIARVYRGAEWRALARGKTGWHPVAGAGSEGAATEGALKSCAAADSECRLYAIGNFKVAAD